MAGLDVEQAAGKMVQEAASASEEAPAPKAPVSTPPDAQPTSEAAPAAEANGKPEELTSFEQELIEEYQEQYARVPENSRKEYLEALKQTYRKHAKQMTELGGLRKAISALRDAGVSDGDLVELINKRRNKLPAAPPTPTGEVTKRGFQRYVAETTDPAERENLTKAEQVVRELVEDLVAEHLGKRVSPLEEKLAAAERQQLSHRSQTLSAEIDALEDTGGYAGSVIEKYREDMLRVGLQNPTLSAEKVLFLVAEVKDLKSSLTKGTKPAEPARKPVASLVKKPSAEALPESRPGRKSVSAALDTLFQKR